MSEYRIEWFSILTNITGHGEWFPSKDKKMLEDNVKHYNKEYRGELTHTLVSR
jgi:hypothetical protein|tara:strand:- start:1567 stop:1725 length:159 start_codon:yes stop_codon:yes gene_type:complete